MSELPRRLSPKTNLSSNWLNRLLDFLRSRDLRPGPGIKLTRTPSGTTVSAVSAGGAADAGEWPALYTMKFDKGAAFMWLPRCEDFGVGNYALLNGSFEGVSGDLPATKVGWANVGGRGTYFLRAHCVTRKEGDIYKVKAFLSLTTSASAGEDGVIYVPLAHVDGAGAVLQLHTGIVSLVYGITDSVRSYSRIYYDSQTKQLRADVTTSHFERGVCIKLEAGAGTSADEDILAYVDPCSCEGTAAGGS